MLICRLRPAKYIDPDVRNYFRHRLLGASVRGTIYHLYPRLLAVHDLDDSIALPHSETRVIEMPSLMRASHLFMQGNGIYLIGRYYLCSLRCGLPMRRICLGTADNEELQVLWVGQSASPQLLLDLFGVDDIFKVDIRIVRPPSPIGTDSFPHCLLPRPDGASGPGYPSLQTGSQYSRTEMQGKRRPRDEASDRATELRRKRDRVRRYAHGGSQ